MYLFEFILQIISNLSLYGIYNYKSFMNKDLISFCCDLSTKKDLLYLINHKDYNKFVIDGDNNHHGFNIIGLDFIDNYIPKNRYGLVNEFFNKYSDEYIKNDELNKLLAKYSFIRGQIGLKSFVKFVTPFINMNNFNDYFNRQIEYNKLQLVNDLNNTFKNGVFKFTLFDIDLNKLNKDYLFFKNDLTIDNNIKVTFVKYDEFIKSIKFKSSFKLYNDLNNHFFDLNYEKHNYLLKSIVVIVEILDHDKKHNIVYLNKLCYHDLIKTLDINQVKYKSIRKTQLFKDIMNKKYRYVDYNEKYEILIKNLNEIKKSICFYEKQYDKNEKRIKDLKLKEKLKFLTNVEKDKLSKRLIDNDYISSQLDDLSNDLIDINNLLIELDKNNDKFVNNLLDEKVNYSFKLKSYL